MSFAQLLATTPLILAEGAIIERLRRDTNLPLDPNILHAAWVDDPQGRVQLMRLYREYLDTGRRHGLPMLLLSPTWRAGAARLAAAGFGEAEGRRINRDGVRLLEEIRAPHAGTGPAILIGGLIGCRGDAYDPSAALGTDDALAHHRLQVEALAESGVDLLLAATLPALSEALGIARACSATTVPYLLSFVVRPTGTLLDGTPLAEAIARIDDGATPAPAGYLANCVHPRICEAAFACALAQAPSVAPRLLGLQANTADLSPEELDARPALVTEDPDPFAKAMLRVRDRFGLKILGGCCGTDARHIEAIARRLPMGQGG
jgi:homocysteine S-methyltransferase